MDIPSLVVDQTLVGYSLIAGAPWLVVTVLLALSPRWDVVAPLALHVVTSRAATAASCKWRVVAVHHLL